MIIQSPSDVIHKAFLINGHSQRNIPLNMFLFCSFTVDGIDDMPTVVFLAVTSDPSWLSSRCLDFATGCLAFLR